jgi:ABC-type multidrug transport system fused ATPase/permease subunit
MFSAKTYNDNFAKPTTTDDDVFNVCRIVYIHDKILALLDGYQANVDERGFIV